MQKRSELAKLTDLGDDAQRLLRQSLSEIIDTTLLKCYLEVCSPPRIHSSSPLQHYRPYSPYPTRVQVKPSMVSSLLRVQNSCTIMESEAILKARSYNVIVRRLIFCSKKAPLPTW